MSLSAYLAKNYLNASIPTDSLSDLSTRPKKRRKKDKSTTNSSTLIIADEEDLLLSTKTIQQNGEDDDRPLFDADIRSAEFRRSKKNNWKTLDVQPTATNGNDAETAAADRILADAAADLDKARVEVDNEDAPAVVETTQDDGPRMSSGARAGLQTAAQTEALEREEAARMAAEKKVLKQRRKAGKDDSVPEEETVYRDATGRRIDISMKRAEARAAELEKLRLEKKEKEDAMGDVQRQQKETRKQDLEDAKFMTVARGADDEDMNAELKERVRWDDPMAQYMAQKQAEEAPRGAKGGGQATAGDGRTRRKVYAGAAPPNRYGISPGWRWDGVDRGNGFEKEWFQARGKKSRNENLEYQWQMDE